MNPFILFAVVYPNHFKDDRDAIVKRLRLCLLLLFSPFFIAPTFAATNLDGFMTPRDLMHNDAFSNINLHNNRNATTTVYGLYVRQFSYVTPGSSCNNSTVIYPTSQNTTVGSFVAPTDIRAGQSAPIGSNYLYNMIYEAMYFVFLVFPVNPPGCALPGCTWGSDTTMYNWCIYLGAIAPVSTSADFTSNVPPSTFLASLSGFYNYNLINNYISLGPISCNDQTLTCKVANQQTQSFS